MTHKSALWTRANQIFKRAITPTLGAVGFKKLGKVYVREIGRVLHVLNHESDDLNTADKISFTLNCGVHVKEVIRVMWNREPTKIDACACLMSVRPQFLTMKGEGWHEIKSSDDSEVDSAAVQKISALMQNTVVPFFDRFPTEKEVAEFLSQPRRSEDRFINPRVESSCSIYGGIIWNQLGECEKCRAAMAQAIAFAGTKRLEAKNAAFAKNFVCEGNPKVGSPQE